LITLVKAPLPSVTTEVATWVVTSQYSVMLSFFKNSWPVTVTLVPAVPAVGCIPMLAPIGSGA
jgi:hypothetical protein